MNSIGVIINIVTANMVFHFCTVCFGGITPKNW